MGCVRLVKTVKPDCAVEGISGRRRSQAEQGKVRPGSIRKCPDKKSAKA